MLPQWQKMLLIMKVWSSVSESLADGMIFFFIFYFLVHKKLSLFILVEFFHKKET